MSTSTAKIVLITGANTGFGRDTAELLVRTGHRVFATMRDIAGKNRDNAEAFKAETARSDAYGEVAKRPGKVFEAVGGIFQSENNPDVNDIPVAISKLISDEKGKRPARVLLGISFGAEKANEAIEPIQKALVEGLGLGVLLKNG